MMVNMNVVVFIEWSSRGTYFYSFHPEEGGSRLPYTCLHCITSQKFVNLVFK